MKPVVFVGQEGLAETLQRSINDALTAHELIKLKSIDFKDKEDKKEITTTIEIAKSLPSLVPNYLPSKNLIHKGSRST